MVSLLKKHPGVSCPVVCCKIYICRMPCIFPITQFVKNTVQADIFAVVLFSRISRVKPSRKFPLQFMSIYSNDNISKIVKLTPRELPHLAKTAKITVRENNGVYSTHCTYCLHVVAIAWHYFLASQTDSN